MSFLSKIAMMIIKISRVVQRVKNFEAMRKFTKSQKLILKFQDGPRINNHDKLKFIIITLTLIINTSCMWLFSGFAALLTYYWDSRIVNDGLTVIMLIDWVCWDKKP